MSSSSSPEMIFVCGTQRSAVDLMLDFLSAPKPAGWLPDKLATHPNRLRHAKRIRYQNWPVLGEFFLERRNHWKSVPSPGRADVFLSSYLSNFNLAGRTFTPPGPEDVKEGEAEALKEMVE